MSEKEQNERLKKALLDVLAGHERLRARLPGIVAHEDFQFRADLKDARALLLEIQGPQNSEVRNEQGS